MNFEKRIVDSGLTYDDEDRRRRRSRWIIIAVVALLAAIGLAWALSGGSEKAGAAEKGAAGAQAEGTAPIVSVVVPGRVDVDSIINATGTLAARREVPVGVVGEGGRVVAVHVDAGSWVSQGQVLVTVERSVQNQQAIGLQAQIKSAEADLRLAQNELSRALALVDRGFISKADVDRKTAARDAAAARVNVARASLAETNARNARLDIRAPSSGLILSRSVQVGQVIGGGTQVFTLAEGGQMEMQAQLNESDLTKLSVGVPVKVTPVGADQSLEGQIWQISPIVNAQTRQGTARVALAYNPLIRPGGFANAQIVGGRVSAPLLPESAIQSDQKGSFVYIVGKDNKVERRDVQTGTVTAQGIAIVGGLSGNEMVVLRAGGFLNPGETVKPEKTKT